jgi:2-C-methyl-D-erythritol 4-phosphate cytidylyltransferase
MNRGCIIVAGGNGSRMGSEVPKQFITIAGSPLLMHTIENIFRFAATIQLVVVLPKNEIISWNNLCRQHNFTIPHQVVAGGNTRFQSVKNGLTMLQDCELIAIHDGVRPLVSHDTLRRCFDSAVKMGTAIPVLPANESVRVGTMEKSTPADRSQIFLVQTPQIFRSSIIRESYNQSWIPEFTDDASVVEYSGTPVKMVLGNRENIKITYPEDLEIATRYLQK